MSSLPSVPEGPVFDVAIIGFGPTGAVAAALLGQAGLRVHVCDLREDVHDRPRAVALDHEILRVLDEIGVLAQVEPWIEPFTDSEYVGVDGQLIKCDPQKDCVPVGLIGRSPFTIMTNDQSPFRGIGDLIARARAESGKVSIANEGPKTFGGMIGRLLNARAQIEANLISYASVSVAVQDTMSGRPTRSSSTSLRARNSSGKAGCACSR